MSDLTAVRKTLDLKTPIARPAKPADDENSFDRVLDRQRKATGKCKPANSADAKKPDDATVTAADAKTDGAKKPAGVKADDQPKISAKHKHTDEAADTVDDADTAAPAADQKVAAKVPLDGADKGETGDEAESAGDKPARARPAPDADAATPDAAALASAQAVPIAQTGTDASASKTDDQTATDAAAPALESTTAAHDSKFTSAAKGTSPAVKNAGAADEKSIDVLDAEKDAKPQGKSADKSTPTAAPTDGVAAVSDDAAAPAAKPAAEKSAQAELPAVDPAVLAPATPHAKANQPAVAPVVTVPTPQRAVAANNVERIVTSVRGNLGANGGTMQIRLDPPTLGTVNVQVSFENGVMTASMQTENEQATRLLSHSLGALKASLESAGVSVDKIQVKQAAPSEASTNQQQSSEKQSQDQASYDGSSRQEQQRREMMQRMWRRVSGNLDDLDLVA